jgi:hypothetical protein
MKKLYASLIFVFVLFAKAQTATWTDEELEERLNYGLKLGMGFSTMLGGELENPRPYFGPSAGFFWYTKEKKSPLAFQTGFEGSLRGSNFANTNDQFPGGGNSNYRRIGIISADIPLLLNYRLGPKKEDMYRCVQLGVLVSGILKSTVYLGPDKLPAQHYLDSTSHLYRWENLPLRPLEFAAVLGYQNRRGVAGWQVQLKAGLNNMNDNFKLPYAYPVTGRGRSIRTASLNFSLVF